MLGDLKYAYVWGRSVKHNPQKVGKDHILMDEDIVQLVKNIWIIKSVIFMINLVDF